MKSVRSASDAFEGMASVPHSFPLDWYPEHQALPQATKEDRLFAYCAEEVRRQGDTPWHVFRLYRAFVLADSLYSMNKRINHAVIRHLGAEIDELAEDGYREYHIYIGGDKRGFVNIHADLTELIERQDILTADDWYYRFELIHPFGDGNGRTGKVLYNWLRGSLTDPVWPHNYFGSSNP